MDRTSEPASHDEKGDDFLSRADIPTTATRSALAFYRQYLDDAQSLGGPSVLVDQLERLVDGISRALLGLQHTGEDPREVFRNLYSQVDHARAGLKKSERTRDQLVVCRFVDNYLRYIADVMGEVFVARPETLSTSAEVKVEDVLRHGTLDDFVAWYADKRVNSLTYKGFGPVVADFERRLGVPFTTVIDRQEQIHRAVAIRNLIVHQRGIVDWRFVNDLQTRGFDTAHLRVGQQLPDFASGPTMRALVASVREIDDKVASKFGLLRTRVTEGNLGLGNHLDPGGPAPIGNEDAHGPG